MLKLGHDENLLLPLNPKSLGKEFRDACKILRIRDLRFHDLRHEGCTRLAEQNFNIPEIQKLSPIRQIALYRRSSKQKVRAVS